MIKSIRNFIIERQVQTFATFFVASFLSLSVVYFVELVLNYKPCELCLYERIPFFVILVVSLFGLFTRYLVKLSKIVIFLSLLANLVLSGYHSGIEHGAFAPLHPCMKVIDVDFSDLSKAPEQMPSCDRPEFYISGLSMTEWNFIWNLSLILVLMMLNLRSKQLKR